MHPGRPVDESPTSLTRSCRITDWRDRKSTRLNSSHPSISYAVFCLKKKNCTQGLRELGSATFPPAVNVAADDAMPKAEDELTLDEVAYETLIEELDGLVRKRAESAH